MAEQNKAEKFVFYMYKMTKSYPPNKEVLKDISLSFYYVDAAPHHGGHRQGIPGRSVD